MAPASAQPGHGRAVARRSTLGMRDARGPPGCLGAGVYVLGWPCGGCEGHFRGCSPPSRQLLILLCLPADGMSACAAIRRRSRGCPNPQQRSLRWQPFSLPRPARPGTARGAWQPPGATCVPGRQLGDGRRDAGRCRGRGASRACRASHGRCPAAPGGMAQAGLQHVPLGAAGRRGGAAGCQQVTQPGWHAVLAGLRACRY